MFQLNKLRAQIASHQTCCSILFTLDFSFFYFLSSVAKKRPLLFFSSFYHAFLLLLFVKYIIKTNWCFCFFFLSAPHYFICEELNQWKNFLLDYSLSSAANNYHQKPRRYVYGLLTSFDFQNAMSPSPLQPLLSEFEIYWPTIGPIKEQRMTAQSLRENVVKLKFSSLNCICSTFSTFTVSSVGSVKKTIGSTENTNNFYAYFIFAL